MPIIDEAVLDQFRHGPCAWCRKKGRTDPHHVTCRGFGGGRRFDVTYNVVALCRDCHGAVHEGRITRNELLAIVAKREGLTPDEIMDLIYRLRREGKGSR